jgi:superoxide dismutase, Fe-Mn family
VSAPTVVERPFAFGNVSGISRGALDLHVGLYHGYVRQVAMLQRQADILLHDSSSEPAVQMRRESVVQRLAFELNGMLLHELFFEQLDGQPSDPGAVSGSAFQYAINASFPSLDAWRMNVISLSQTRGIGWVITSRDPGSGLLGNYWIGEHHIGVPLGHQPIAVFDLWEHAYLPDHADGSRKEYMSTLFRNLDWSVLDQRIGMHAPRT